MYEVLLIIVWIIIKRSESTEKYSITYQFQGGCNLLNICNIVQKLYFIPILNTLPISKCNADAINATNAAENERVMAEATGLQGSCRSTGTSRLEANIMFAEAMGESSGSQPRRSTGSQTRASGRQAVPSGSQVVPSDSQAGASGRPSAGTCRFFGINFRRSNR